MTKKSAAQMKVVHPMSDENKMKALQEEFDIAKFGFLETLKVNMKISNRVDNLLNIMDYAKNFWGADAGKHDDIEYLKKLRYAGYECYARIYEIASEWELVDFMKPEIDNYLKDVPEYKSGDDVNSMEELAIAGIEFLSVKPWGEKMMGMHRVLQEKMDELDIKREED